LAFSKSDPSGTEGQLAYEKIKPRVIATGNEFCRRHQNLRGPQEISATRSLMLRKVSMIGDGGN
jgi:hypothetical protein